MNKDEVLGRLRVLARLNAPVWLAGGVAVDFLVGRWTRDHGDVDLVAFEEDRERLDQELRDLGFEQTDDRGWITNWTNSGRKLGEVSLAYVRRVDETTGALVMLPSYRGVVPGIYPGVPGGLAVDHFRTLDDVRFRVSSPEEEWAYADGFTIIRPDAGDRETVRSNLALLEAMIDDVGPLRGWYAAHRASLDAQSPKFNGEGCLIPADRRPGVHAVPVESGSGTHSTTKRSFPSEARNRGTQAI